VSGAEAMTVSGFGTYQLDAGTSWTLIGTNALAGAQRLTVGGSLDNTGALAGEAGATGADSAQGNGGGGGAGGLGVAVAATGTVANGGALRGGAGGSGGFGYHYGGGGGAGANAADLASGGILTNMGTVGGGAGGAGGAGGITSGGAHHNGAAGAAGDGVVLTAGGRVINGGKSATTTLISGLIGVYAGPTGAATVTSFGTIAGTGGVAVEFKSASDKLIVESGSTWTGSVQGGGGTLDLAGGTGTVRRIGAAGTVSGAEAMSFSGFGSYVFAKGTWTLAGANTLAAGATMTDNAKLTNTGALTVAGSLGGKGALTLAAGTAAIGAGAKITVATWSLTGGTTSLNESLTYKGAFSETTTATLTVAAGDKLTLSGAAIMSGLINGAGTVAVATATLKTLTVGGTTALTITGAASQAGLVTIGDATAAAASLTIAKGATYTIAGVFGIAEGAATTSALTVAGTLIKSGATGRSVIAVATADTGLIEAATGTLDFTAALTGTGALKVDSGAILEADGAIGKNLAVSFNGASATLALKAPASFAATIAGFAPTDTVDLIQIAATGAKINGKDQLVIVNGATTVAKLQLTGAYSGATFTIAADGHGGTAVTLVTAAGVSPPASLGHQFVAAMASLGPCAGAMHAAGGAHAGAWRPSLWAPRARPA
jgi:hypothetical protein